MVPPKSDKEKLTPDEDVNRLIIRATLAIDSSERSEAALALGEIGGVRVVETLIEILYDKYRDPLNVDEVRESAAEALGKIGGERAFKALADALGCDMGSNSVVESCVWALKEIKDVRVVETLIEALEWSFSQDDDEISGEEVKGVIASALGEIGSERAIKALIEALGNYDADDHAENVLLLKGALVVEPLIEALKDEDNYDVYRVARVLGEIGDVRAVEPLIEALKVKDVSNDNYFPRLGAALALGEIGDVRAVEPLIEALKVEEKYSDVWEYIWMALRAFGSSAVDALIQTLKDKDSNSREMAAWALGEIEAVRAVEPLTEALKDKESTVRSEAKSALEKINNRKQTDPLS